MVNDFFNENFFRSHINFIVPKNADYFSNHFSGLIFIDSRATHNYVELIMHVVVLGKNYLN